MKIKLKTLFNIGFILWIIGIALSIITTIKNIGNPGYVKIVEDPLWSFFIPLICIIFGITLMIIVIMIYTDKH